MRRSRHFGAPFASAALVLLSQLPAVAQVGASQEAGDLDGDGRADVVVGAPGANVAQQSHAGRIVTLSVEAQSGERSLRVERAFSAKAFGGEAESGANLGSTALVGDIDDDGYGDLIVGAPGVDSSAGAVFVRYGSSSGLGDRSQELSGEGAAAQAGSSYGRALAIGDFNADGVADLAVGAPGAMPGPPAGSGHVEVWYGAKGEELSSGTSRHQTWDESSPGAMGGSVAGDDRFGDSLASGDMNGDGRDDLAIGVPLMDDGESSDSGAVRVLYGSDVGLSSDGSQLWSLSSDGVRGQSQNYETEAAVYGDRYGATIAIGDFDADGFADMAVGIPDKTNDTFARQGAASILYGSSAGLTSRDQYLTQASPGVPGKLAFSSFGASLAACDLNDDGRTDLAVGAPNSTVHGRAEAGSTFVLYGGKSGIRTRSASRLTQDTAGLPGKAERKDHFGASLWCGRVTPGALDLVVGAPDENAGGYTNVGVVAVLPGSPAGVNPARALSPSSSAVAKATGGKQARFGHLGGNLRQTDSSGRTQ